MNLDDKIMEERSSDSSNSNSPGSKSKKSNENT